MKSLKTIIIAGGVFLVFVIASIVILNIPVSTETRVEESVVETTKKETIYVVNRNYDELVRFTIEPTERDVDEDTAYAYASEKLDVEICRVEDEQGSVSYEYEVSPDPGKFEYDTSKFRSMLYTLSSITATNLVEEDASDISIYGLDEPTAVIHTYYSDDSQVDIIVGSQAPVDGEYYVMTNQSDAVYTIGSYVDSLLVRRPIEYRDITLFPAYEDDAIYENIDWVRLTNRDGDVIEVQLDANFENEYNTEESQYVMLQPYQVSGNTTTIQSYVLDVVSTLSLGSILRDINEDEYGDYGLAHPAKLEMTDIAGNSISLLIGNACPNREYTYCMIEGTNTLLTAGSSAFDFMDVTYVQLMLRTAWTFNIEELQGMDITIDDQVFDLDVTHYIKQNANGNDTDGVQGILNGQEIDELNVRRLFIKCLYFRIIGNLTDEEKETMEKTEPYATITITLEDGDHVLELMSLTDRKYAMRVDGVLEYYCNKSSLEDLETSLGYVLDGDILDFAIG